jgi:hypothetical protein
VPLYDADRLIQTASTELTVDTSTTSTTYVDLMSVTITTGTNSVIIQFSSSCTTNVSGDWCEFQLLIDGVITRGLAIWTDTAGVADSGALVYKSSVLSAGSHTFNIQWHVGTAGTAQIRPVTTVLEHATLYVEEVTV